MAAAISWYQTSCRPRIGEDVTKSTSYSLDGTCGEVVDGEAYPTYAVKAPIASSDNADVVMELNIMVMKILLY